MTIRPGEIGKELYVGTGFDLSSNTELTLNFKLTDRNISFSRNSADGVTAPGIDSPDLPDVGILPANTYMLYITQANDFAFRGAWCVNAQYEDATSVLFIGDNATLTVSAAC